MRTATGLLTAQDLGLHEQLFDPQQIERFIASLEVPAGGFHGANWNPLADVEYTFYSLGVLGLLWSGSS